MLKEPKTKKYQAYKTIWMLNRRTMERIGQFSHRLAEINERIKKLIVFSEKLERSVLGELKDKKQLKEVDFNKLGDEYLEDLDWAVNPIIEWVLGIPPKEIDEETVYELAGEIKEKLKKKLKNQ